MEKKQVLMVLLSLAINTGCKNESKTFIAPSVEITPGSVGEIKELTIFEKVVLAQIEVKETRDRLIKARNQKTEVIKERNNIQETLELETNVIFSSNMANQIAVLDQKVSGLNEQIDLNQQLIEAKTVILNNILMSLTEEEKKQIDETDFESQIVNEDLEEKKLRIEITYDAQEEALKNQRSYIDKINFKIIAKSDELESLESTGQGESDRARILRVETERLNEDLIVATKQRTLLTAIKESFADEMRNL